MLLGANLLDANQQVCMLPGATAPKKLSCGFTMWSEIETFLSVI
jgi:hypothetical protein